MPSRRALVLLAPLIMRRSSPLAYTPYPFTWSAGRSAGFQLRSTLCVNWRSRWSLLGDGTPNRQTRMTIVTTLNYNLGQKMCWKMAKTWNYNRYTYRISVNTPIPPFNVGKCKMQTCVRWKCFVNIAQGWGGAKCVQNDFFQPLWPRL